MSQSSAVRSSARHASRPAPAPAQPRLRVVTAPEYARSRAGAVVGCAVLLVGGLIALLLLQMSLERGAYALQAAQGQARRLGERQQTLREDLERLQAPQNLASRAAALGMVQASNPAFLRASDGKVLGVPAPGVATPSPTVTPAVSASPSGQPTAKGQPTAASKATANTSTRPKATTSRRAPAPTRTP